MQVVERGNRIFFIATFQADPSEVHFIYTRPGETRPVADPGYGQKNSIISRRTYDDSDDIEYIASVDTTGFRGGFLEWHFFSAGIHQKSDFGTRDNGRAIQIPDRPPQLL